jgi:nicotinate-nucleotide adenylyltransferase
MATDRSAPDGAAAAQQGVSRETSRLTHEESAAAGGDRDGFRAQISRGFVRLPPFARGLRVGLFGGSFNPAHQGHRAASLLALRRLRLDCVWWLVSPGNPLKDRSDLAPMSNRMEAARRLAAHPRIKVSGFEAAIGATYSFETVAWLKARCPGVRFVWIMGADNLAGLHRWRRWRDLAALVPIAVIDRPGSTLKSMSSRAARILAPDLLPESEAGRLATAPPPALVFLHGPRSGLSSTALRARR